MITKSELDKLAQKYETKEFFYDDPIGIPNRFENKKDKEIAGFIASLVAYGRREVFIKKLNQLLEIAQNEPYNFITNFEPELLGDFNYRFGKPDDFAQIFDILKDLYNSGNNLEELFKYGYEKAPYLTRDCNAHSSLTITPSPTKKCCRRGESLLFDINLTRDCNAHSSLTITPSPTKKCCRRGESLLFDINLTRDCNAHSSLTITPSPTKKCCRRGESLLFDINLTRDCNAHSSLTITPSPTKECCRRGELIVSRSALLCRHENMFIPITDYFYSRAKDNTALGFKFMIPDARKGSAMKRMCMYLRWMVRKGEVDFGIWDFMPESDLFIPLDTHVARISREMGLLTRKANDFQAVIELTENLKKFDPQDPVKYDFAIFGYGVNNK